MIIELKLKIPSITKSIVIYLSMNKQLCVRKTHHWLKKMKKTHMN